MQLFFLSQPVFHISVQNDPFVSTRNLCLAVMVSFCSFLYSTTGL